MMTASKARTWAWAMTVALGAAACGAGEDAGGVNLYAGAGGGPIDGGAVDGGDSGDAAAGGDAAPGSDAAAGGDSAAGDAAADGDAAAGDGGGFAVIDAEAKPQPLLVAKLDGKETELQSFWIDPNPQADNSKLKIKIELSNQGDVPLRIDALTFASETKQISLDWYDEPLKDADYPYELAPFHTLTLSALWLTKPKLEGQAIATLTVHSNDPKRPALVLTVATPCTDAKAVLQPATITIVNAAPYNGKVACTALGNIGCQPLTVQQVALKGADPRFKIVSAPAPGTKIGIYGSGDNPTAAPVALPICVRFEPSDDSKAPATAELVVDAFGGSAQKASAQVKTAWVAKGTYTLACGGAQKLELGAGPPGGTASCKLQNHGPSALKVAALALEVGDQTVDLAAVEAAFAVDIEQGGPQQAPWTLAAFAVAKLRVHWKANAAPPAARLRVVLAQDSEVETLHIPIFAGGCDAPALVFGPAPPTFLAKPGASATTVLTVANQGCAPLAIVDGCLTGYQVSQDSACTTGSPSAEYSVAAGALVQTLPPFGMSSITLKFAPLAPLGKPHYGQLHLYWCHGLWNGSVCTGKTIKTSVQLEGNSSAGVVPASAKLVAIGSPKVGQSLWLEGSVIKGSHAIGDQGAFTWLVSKRPSQSTAWFVADVTDGAARTFAPDLPGTYRVEMRVAAFTPDVLTTQSMSPPAILEFTVP